MTLNSFVFTELAYTMKYGREGPTLYKCYTNVLYLLGTALFRRLLFWTMYIINIVTFCISFLKYPPVFFKSPSLLHQFEYPVYPSMYIGIHNMQS